MNAKQLAIEALELVDASINIAGEIDDYPAVDNKIMTALAALREDEPIDMILFCPACCTQHVDKDNSEDIRIEAAERGFVHGSRDWEGFIEEREWTNPPHRSHLCHSCGHIWRPADVPTNGVLFVQTKGKADSIKTNPLKYVHAAAQEGYAWGIEHARPKAPDGWPSTHEDDTLDADALGCALGNALSNAKS